MSAVTIAAETRGQAFRRLKAAFADAGIETPELDARLLLLAALGISLEALIGDWQAPLSAAERRRLDDHAARRLSREPVARILGRREFWSFDYDLNAATLVPRPETETLVAAVLDLVGDAGGRDRPLRIADLGTGSGCILISLLSELPQATGIGIDIVPEAITAARNNAARAGFAGRAHFIVGDYAAALKPGLDVVVSNPPYIAGRDLNRLMPEVRDHDPLEALAGGRDGLDAYRAIAGELPRLLGAGGIVALEIGAGQEGAVSSLLKKARFEEIRTWCDLAARPRVVSGRRP